MAVLDAQQTQGKHKPFLHVASCMHIFCLNVHHAEELPACVGLGAVASYGAISNITYGGGLAVAWIAFVRQFSKSPLMEGQWKAFLAFYAGMLIMLYPRYADPASFSAAV